MQYLRLYLIKAAPPGAPIVTNLTDHRSISILPGPFTLQRGVMIPHHHSGGSAYTMGLEDCPFPEGAYIAFSSAFERGVEHAAILAATELAAIADLIFPNVLAELVFEGTPATPHQVYIGGESPREVRAGPQTEVSVMPAALEAGIAGADQLSADDRSRLRLCSRWFRRGIEASNDVDKFLFWYIVLEVFPAANDTDVPGRVRDFLHTSVASHIPASVIKERLSLGQIAGLRARIVHDGLALMPLGNDSSFRDLLGKLEAVCRTCLRLLANLPPGTELAKWLPPAIT